MKKIAAVFVLVSIYLSVLSPLAVTINAQRRTAPIKPMQEPETGLRFRLSSGTEASERPDAQQPSVGDPLSATESNAILGRLPAIKTDAKDQNDFAKREGSQPPPKTGERIPVNFPADEKVSRPNTGNASAELKVLRFSPEGEVSLAPDLSITFSAPMVAVTSQEQAAQTVPVEMSPSVPGRWRWLGTQTLMFDTDKRFPMATQFKVRVPAGTRSATGQTLAKDVSWTFATPPPKMIQSMPSGTTSRDAVMFAAFDQDIDRRSILENVAVIAGGKTLNVRLATDDEIAADAAIATASKGFDAKRWLAFRAVNADGSTANALPGDTTVTFTFKKGTPSAEGPIRTAADQSSSFKTFGAMKFKTAYCGWQSNKNCDPFTNLVLEFTNYIDAAKFNAEMVRIEPAIPGAKIFPSGNTIQIAGVKKGRTAYTITVDRSLLDRFGQTLVEPAKATIKVGSAGSQFYSQGGGMIVLDPAAKPNYSIYTINHAAAKLRIYSVTPADWDQYRDYRRYVDYDDGKKRTLPGKLVVDRTIAIKNTPDELTETAIDLSPALNGGLGNVIVEVEPTVKRDKYDRSRTLVWVQSTKIGLDAFVDNAELIGFATDLMTGKPLGGVELSIFPTRPATPVETSAVAAESADEGLLSRAWNWLTGIGSADETTAATDNDGTVAVEEVSQAGSKVTAANGVLRLPLPDKASGTGQDILIARSGKDTAFLPEQSEYFWNDSGSWHKRPSPDRLSWFVFNDRGIYKPGEEVALKGYIRRIEGGKLGDIQGPGDTAAGITYSVKDARSNEITKGTASLNAFGAFDLKFSLPDNIDLGYARVELSTTSELSGQAFSHSFQIQEFRRPEFEVSAKVETEAPHFVGGSANVAVEAKYYAGGGLANAETNWTVTAMPTNYTPPNRDDFTFGVWVPWWRYYGGGRGATTVQNFAGTTDASGKHILKIDFESAEPARPYALTASAAVQDVNRQTWSGSTSLLVHPSSLYVGIRSERTFAQKGEKIDVSGIVTDIEGKLIANRAIEMKATLKDNFFENGTWQEKVVDEQTCSITSAEQAVKCSFTAKQGGRYTISATVMDDRERRNQSEITIWVPGGKTIPNRSVEQEEVQLIPSKKEYAPGEVAEILVIAPFSPAEGILTLRRDGIVKAERFTIKDGSITLKIPIEERYLPNIHAQVDIVGAADRETEDGKPAAAKRPAFASGSLDLSVSLATRKLNVTAEPASATLVPGGSTKLNVAVTDSAGRPVANSEVAVVIVDESVLALTGYAISDPLGYFYQRRGQGVTDHHLRKDLLLGRPDDVATPPPPPAPVEAASGAMRDDAKLYRMAKPSSPMNEVSVDAESAPTQEAIALRENFNALAVFAPSVRTDSAGKAVVDVKLPDNLTRYRITAVSVDQGKRFGKVDSAITARKPLMVRPSAPRFLNFGDRAELPVVVQNQTDRDMTVDVAMRASNAVVSGSGDGNNAGQRVVVKANDRTEVRFPVTTDRTGTARFQFAVTSGSYSDAAEISLPVWTPATTEAFATYGSTDKNGAIIQPVQTPGDVWPQFGGLEVTTSSTQLQELTDAYIYLANYPFECTEQVSSRMISTAALRDVLNAFKAKDMPTAAQLEQRFARDIDILRSRQRNDGSFGLWRRDRERYEYPFVTVHTAHALALAKAKGYKVPEDMIAKTRPYLKNVENYMKDEWYRNSPSVRWTISAYALYVRGVMGDNDREKAKKLLAEATIEKMPFEALGWILSVLAGDATSSAEIEAITRFLMNRTTETAATANFVTNYGDGAWLIMYSNRRADGVLLESLIKVDPENTLVPKLVRGLLAHRTKGAWSNTQENVFILLALDKYFQAYEKVTPDFITRVWLGNAYAGEQRFSGRSTDSNVLNIPMSSLTGQGGTADLLMDKQGPGRLYYRIGMKYAPKNLKLEPADYGFSVIRKYEAVDEPEDVKQNADGSWTFKAGARVRVRLSMVAQARRYHVALVDNLPAGLEILNPGLAVTEAIPADTNRGNTGVAVYGSRSYGRGSIWYRANWFDHQNFRDERTEAFAALLWEGVYDYTYVTRATTPGQFVVPPAKAEEMYHPETFGRSGTDRVIIE